MLKNPIIFCFNWKYLTHKDYCGRSKKFPHFEFFKNVHCCKVVPTVVAGFEQIAIVPWYNIYYKMLLKGGTIAQLRNGNWTNHYFTIVYTN